jgi:hypothetical protein
MPRTAREGAGLFRLKEYKRKERAELSAFKRLLLNFVRMLLARASRVFIITRSNELRRSELVSIGPFQKLFFAALKIFPRKLVPLWPECTVSGVRSPFDVPNADEPAYSH